MGLFDFLPCCGRGAPETKADEPTDSDPLLARPAESITSQEGYGSVSMAPDGGMSGKQRQRLADIGREVGNHMLPINQASRASTTSPSARQPSAARAPSPESGSSPSRPTTPCPERDGSEALAPDADDDGHSTVATRSGAATPTAVPDADGVVHKQLFHNATGGGNGKRGGHGGRGKKGGRGRGRGRSKKMK